MKLKTKPNIFLIAAGILFCLVLVSVHFSAGMYARYVTKAQGSDQARLASFYVTAEIEEKESGEFIVTVSNSKSETAAACTLKILLDEIPAGKLVTVKLGDRQQTFDSNVVSFDVGAFAPGDVQKFTLAFELTDTYTGSSASDDWKDYDNKTMAADSGEMAFKVYATLTQLN